LRRSSSRFLFSWRRTDRGGPSIALAADFTAFTALNFPDFFFLAISQQNLIPADAGQLVTSWFQNINFMLKSLPLIPGRGSLVVKRVSLRPLMSTSCAHR
jgi:hypothetical protein